MKTTRYTLCCLIFLQALSLFAQQNGDPDFQPKISHPSYSQNKGPQVLIDEGHNNFHTLEGRYQSFAKLVAADGYQMGALKGQISKDKLAECRILVISNALHKSDVGNWVIPNPSAFTEEEIETLNVWVKEGGSLFLIADHMPFPGASGALAASFGFKFRNGFALEIERSGGSLFTRQANKLSSNLLSNGRNKAETVDSIYSFTGQGFKIPGSAQSVLSLGADFQSLEPDTAWRFTQTTPRISMEDHHQLAYMEYGKGRLVVSGEAAMFSAQLAGQQKRKMGMNAPYAKDNYKLLLNIIRWLDHQLN
ncbi:MAG: hypothetical protein R8P61_12225 [Bacteroidia bacterium]|nr:hypothetical protein [Bacteroidia bacterium]